MPTQNNTNPEYMGELRSGNFGPDSGMYRVSVEVCGGMYALEGPDTIGMNLIFVEYGSVLCHLGRPVTAGEDHWHTREEAWEASRLPDGTVRNGHVAVRGVSPEAESHHQARRTPNPAVPLAAHFMDYHGEPCTEC